MRTISENSSYTKAKQKRECFVCNIPQANKNINIIEKKIESKLEFKSNFAAHYSHTLFKPDKKRLYIQNI